MKKIVKSLSAVAAMAFSAVAIASPASAIVEDPTIIMGVRNAGATGDFTKNVVAKPGEQVSADVFIYNTTGQKVDNMDARVNLDTGGYLSIVPNSATLTTKKGTANVTDSNAILRQFTLGAMSTYLSDTNGDGVAEQGWATLRFKVQVPNTDKLLCGTNSYHLGAQATAYMDGKIASDTERYDVSITVTGKACNEKPKEELPFTGPASVIAPVIGVGSLATASAYYVISRKK